MEPRFRAPDREIRPWLSASIRILYDLQRALSEKIADGCVALLRDRLQLPVQFSVQARRNHPGHPAWFPALA